MNFAEPSGQVAVLCHGSGDARGVEDGAVGKRQRADHRCDEHGRAEDRASDQARGGDDVVGSPLLPVAEDGESECGGQNVGEDIHRRVPGEDADESFLRIFHLAGHAGKLLVAGVIPHSQGQAPSKDCAQRLTWRDEGKHRVVVQME